MLQTIRDFLWIHSKLATAGQPRVDQFAAIAAQGFTCVINLLPEGSEFYLPGERAIVESLGMAYVSIPVVWTGPTLDDFERFCTAMETHSEQKLFVHCAANKRVSVFLYLWRTRRQGEDESDAAADLRDIWVPDGVWAAFMDRVGGAGVSPSPAAT